MKKLYENIEEVSIKGRPEELTQVVDSIDITMQEFANETENVKVIMYKYSGTNQGIQYKNACDAITDLSNQIYDASEELNELQRQVVEFQNKCYRYEGLGYLCTSPRSHNINRIRVLANTSSIDFKKPEMIIVRDALERYSCSARDVYKKLQSDRDYIGTIWEDRQFRDFSSFIDEVCIIIENGCKNLDEYKDYLHARIKEITE